LYNYLYFNILEILWLGVPKQAALHGKSHPFRTQNNGFCNVKVQLSLFNEVVFTKEKRLSTVALSGRKQIKRSDIYWLSL